MCALYAEAGCNFSNYMKIPVELALCREFFFFFFELDKNLIQADLN